VWWVWLVFAAANLADLAVQASWGHFSAVVTAILVTITGVAYACALRPRVVADEVGLTVHNPLRDYHVPWSAIRNVDGGDWVRVHCGEEADARTVYCWALFVPARARIKASRRTRGTWPAGLMGSTRRQARVEAVAGPAGGNAVGSAADGRLPDEARRLASLPTALAIAERLDARARQERARARRSGAAFAPSASDTLRASGAPDASAASVVLDTSATRIMGAWAWWSVAAMIVPALGLAIVALT
jgi:Bacterial PH domain